MSQPRPVSGGDPPITTASGLFRSLALAVERRDFVEALNLQRRLRALGWSVLFLGDKKSERVNR